LLVCQIVAATLGFYAGCYILYKGYKAVNPSPPPPPKPVAKATVGDAAGENKFLKPLPANLTDSYVNEWVDWIQKPGTM